MKALTTLFHLLSVQLPLSFQDQGHNTLAALVVRKILFGGFLQVQASVSCYRYYLICPIVYIDSAF